MRNFFDKEKFIIVKSFFQQKENPRNGEKDFPPSLQGRQMFKKNFEIITKVLEILFSFANSTSFNKFSL